MSRFVLAAAALTGTGALGACPLQTPRAPASILGADRIEAAVREEALERGVPGVAVAIVRRGEVEAVRAFGVADLETGRPITLETTFNIASLTKSFTAILAVSLAADSLVSLDSSVATYLPDLPSRYADVTIRHLLGHTSGVDRDLREENLDDPDAEEYRFRLDTASVRAPGERWEYSNSGYTLLGWALAAAGGESVAELMRKRIFQPFDMRSARYRVPPGRDSLRARPYEVTAEGPRPAAYVTGGFASGGLSMSISDLASFAVALHGDRLLTQEQKRLLWTPVALESGEPVKFELFDSPAGYGYGWFLATYLGRRLVTHGGGISGYSSNFYHFPDEGVSLVVLANAKARDDGSAPVDVLARRLAAEYFEEDSR